MREAKSIIFSYIGAGRVWMEGADSYASRVCHGLAYLDEVFYDEGRNGPSLFDLAEVPKEDPRWSRPSWEGWLGFCPMGFAAALVARARAARVARRVEAARHDLEMVYAMLGGKCGFIDYLDRRFWGVNSEDVVQEFALLDGWSASAGRQREVRQLKARELQWHALQLNTLLRLRLRELPAPAASAAGPPAPRFAMLTFPSYMAIFLVPMLERIWGRSLSLSIFQVGGWKANHSKCADCMQRWGRDYLEHIEPLEAIPYNSSASFRTGGGDVIWGSSFGLGDFRGHLRAALATGLRLKAADLLFCIAAMWVCAMLAGIDGRPQLALDLVLPTLHAPDDLAQDPAPIFTQQLVLWREFQAWVERRPGARLRRLWVREEPLRSYGYGEFGPVQKFAMPLEARGIFYPFVTMHAIHIQDRYACIPEQRNIIVMREGSSSWSGKFSMTVVGKFFLNIFKLCAKKGSPWNVRLLPFSQDRLSYAEIADHRAAVWMPLAHYAKQTFNDLVMMGMPLFMPNERLQSSISRILFCAIPAEVNKPLAHREECRWQMVGRRLALAKFLRHPHVERFGSLADLVARLSEAQCPELQARSERMRRWNAVQVEEDAAFWKLAVEALLAEARAPPEPGDKIPGAGLAASSQRSLPDFLPPHVPDGPRCDDVPEAAYCDVHEMGPGWKKRCCEFVQQLVERTPGKGGQPPPPGTPPRERCLWHPDECSDVTLRHGSQLLDVVYREAER